MCGQCYRNEQDSATHADVDNATTPVSLALQQNKTCLRSIFEAAAWVGGVERCRVHGAGRPSAAALDSKPSICGMGIGMDA
mmetsp:Transcript_8445/g.20249  ORF Transcript_8445/g.20249 Transcript_8445/m.20249 type:complete len:81 (+) Transcript_8445:744-986(+)